MRLSGAVWDVQTPPLERVYAVVFGLSYPVDLSYIAERAGLSPDTTHRHLEQLRDIQIVEVESYSSTQMYSFAESHLSIRTLYQLYTQRTQEELADMDANLSSQIKGWQREYETQSPQMALASTDDASGSSTPPPLVLGEWLFIKHCRTLIQTAQAALTTTDDLSGER